MSGRRPIGRARWAVVLASVSLAASAFAASGRAAPNGAPPVPEERFLPGHEDAVLALLGPGPVEALRCASWRVDRVRPGPACEVGLDLREDGTGAARTVALRPRRTSQGPGSASVVVVFDGAAAPDGALTACLAELLAAHDPGDFFEGKCERGSAVTLPEGAAGDAEAAERAARGYPFGYLRTLLFLAAIVAGLLLLRPPRGGAAADPDATRLPRSARRERWAFAALAAAAVLVRAWLCALLGPGPLELENFGVGVPFDLIQRQTCALTGYWTCDPGSNFHPPLLATALDLWLPLGDLFDAGGTLAWLRAPNLALTVALLWLLVRVGRVTGAPAAGWAAAVLAAFLPELVRRSVYQGPYFAELVAAAWFLERLATGVLARRPAHRSLMIAAAAAVWTGYMSLLVVVPGVLLHAGATLRRGQRRTALVALLLLAGLLAPIAGHAIESVVRYGHISVSGVPDSAAAAVIEAVHGHGVLDGSQLTGPQRASFLGFAPFVADRLLGSGGPWLALAGLVALFVRRPRAGWFPLVPLAAFAAAWSALYLRWDNLTPLFPIALFVPLWGFAALPALALRPRRLRLSGAACAAVVAVALTTTLARAWGESNLDSAADLARWASGGADVVSLAADLRAPAERSLPVLLLSTRQYAPLLCRHRGPLAARQVCRAVTATRTRDRETLLDHLTVGGRAVAQYSLVGRKAGVGGAACPRADRLVARAPWSLRPRFVLVSRGVIDDVGGDCAATFTPPSCSLVETTPSLHLYRCPPAG